MSMATVHSILDKKQWDLNEIKLLLENDASSVKYLNCSGLTPLHRVLKDKKNSIDVIKCLLHYGANPNCLGRGNVHDNHPVFISLQNKRDKEVIKLLLEAGAEVDSIYDNAGHSPLCIALRYDPAADLVQLLLEAGCSLKKRSNHISALHCSMSYPGSKLKADICKILLKEDASFLLQDGRQSRSFLCHVLSWDAEPEAIKLLLEAGCSLNACQEHYSALGCAVDQPGILKASTVQLLVDAGAKIKCVRKISQDEYLNRLDGYLNRLDGYRNKLIYCVLETSNYETDVIKLLCDSYNACFRNGWPTRCILHSAVKNLYCKPEVLQFLIDQGANAGEVNYFGFTPLHVAVENDNCQPAIIEILLSNGCPANRTYGMHQYTALKEALDKGRGLNIIEELLKGGARLAAATSAHLAAASNISKILKMALEKYDFKQCQENINFVKTILKYAYLENPKFDIKDLALGRKYYSVFSNINNLCMQEIKILISANIYKFISRYSDYKPKARGNQLLKVSSVNTFSVYFDVLCITYGRKAMEKRLQVQPMYCISSNSNACKVILNYDIVRKIAGYLVDEDLFSLLVALFNPNKPTYYAKEKNPFGQQRSEEPTRPRKRSRLCY